MFSWGEDTNYGFGLRKLDGSNPINQNHFINFTNLRSDVRDLSAGQSVVAFVRTDGKASIVRIREDQDGRRSTGKLRSVNCEEKIHAVSCGDDFAVLLSEEGKVLIMDSSNIVRPLKELCNTQVNQVACGDQHSIVLTQDGQVFTWGMNTFGQLGLDLGTDGHRPPQVLHSLSGLPLIQVTSGGDHCIALSVSGAVFTWGRNSCGQLGLGDTTDRHVPTPVTLLDRKKTVSISCGKDHTVILTKGGVVFTFGGGRYGQLGHNTQTDEHRPRVVAELWGSKVTQVACGRHHTLAFVGSAKVYSFGHGEHGQLGNGILTDQSVPLPVQISQESDDQKIKRIFAGGNHSFAMTTSAQGVIKVRQKTLVDGRVDEWISKCDTKSWKRIQKEIKAMFSSSSCLNQSFLDRSNKHYQTSSKYSGLDLSLARKVLKKLAKKEKVLAEIKTVVLHSLLPTLNENPFSVESLRVYLVLSELLRATVKPNQVTDIELTVAVAAAILRLHPNKLQILGDLWSSLKPSTLVKQIQMWKDTLSFILRTLSITSHRTGVKDLLDVLQHLFTATQKAGGTLNIPVSAFCMDDVVFSFQYLQEDVKRWRLWSKKKKLDGMSLPIVCRYPFVMNPQSKQLVLNVAAYLSQGQLETNHENGMWPFGIPQPSSSLYFELRLRRASLIEDTFRELNVADPSIFKKHLVVYFDGDSQLSDVYRRDFFLHVLDSLLDPDSKMFMYNHTKTLAWFPAMPILEEKRYFFFGVLCGLALHGNMVVHLPFPLALFKKLLNRKPSLEDLIDFSSDGQILKDILDYPDDVVENLDMTFTVIWDNTRVELDSKEPEKLVTGENKMEFSEAYVNLVFNKSVEGVFAEFRRGFFTVCEEDAALLFRPEELRAVMVGSENYDWEKLKQNTVYEGMYNAVHPTIFIFWEVFEELSEEKKRAFLLFLTGCLRVPILGMGQIRMRVQNLANSSEHHFPEALTCHSLLLLPMYRSKEILQARLIEALCHNRGFWRD
ncbi:probable E3 ubiquitin-protein ligase HERC3 isoform X2 [Osmerus eperlanus]|uniref:probable E3 ubiquitin-protein ligase HERC3 isoform X2 n=1 Tax=Osmerus eperlanus TaxID=29151 RepID=UPI002E14FB8D